MLEITLNLRHPNYKSSEIYIYLHLLLSLFLPIYVYFRSIFALDWQKLVNYIIPMKDLGRGGPSCSCAKPKCELAQPGPPR